ncbi:MAG: helix-turn-helix domain-containing protein [Clostridiaceae bacterium]
MGRDKSSVISSFRDFMKDFMTMFPYIVEVTDDDGGYICEASKSKSVEGIHFPIKYNDTVYYIEIEKQHESNIPLLKFIFEEKLSEIHTSKENALSKLIDGKWSENADVEKLTQMANNGVIILIKAKGNSKEVYDIIQYSYSDDEYMYCIWKDYVVLLGEFDEVYDHCSGILNNVQELSANKPRIAFEKLHGDTGLNRILEKLKGLIELSDRVGVNREIINSNTIIFERVMDGIDMSLKEDIVGEYRDYFKHQDQDTLKMIDVFFQQDLNISETSKELFVHRNTLLYRLDKIKKETSLDLRNFNEAMTFYIIYFLWKSSIK